jgi:hypothetical protein
MPALCLLALAASFAEPAALPRADGYRGIWYMNQPSKDRYGYKYSGGMATYPQQHVPIAIYSRAADKTFFVYGGVDPKTGELLHMVAYFDHKTGKVPRPAVLLNKNTTDAHDNPTLQIDDRGHLWVFSSSHGAGRPSYIHRSTRPYAIDRFELIEKTNFSYTQPWHIPGEGFLFLHTKYDKGRGLRWMTSPDGRAWGEPKPLAKIAQGDYQVSWRRGKRVGTALDYHPAKGGLNARTNLYYLQTDDAGQTWATAEGKRVDLPLIKKDNPALVRDYEKEGKLVYLKDLAFDAAGRPVILYLTADGYASGPGSGTRQWHTARWTGKEWEYRPFTTSDHNYDHGSLTVEPDGPWQVLAPTEPGPQEYGTGGEMVLWRSKDRGATWEKARQVTRGSKRNHTYARKPVDAHEDFYALWADGDAFVPSPSALYFTNRKGDRVWRLPTAMKADEEKPKAVE